MLEKLILNFKDRIEGHPTILLESICLSDNTGLLWSKSYIARNNRNIYSHSKSFTSLMVGIAIDEGKINLNTRLVDVFKDEIDRSTYQRLYDITVKDLLMMSSGFDESFLMSSDRRKGIGYPDYFNFVISKELKEKPGTKFHYSNGDTYLLSRIITKVYNQPFYQVCYQKIFLPLEIGLPMWGFDPTGHALAATELCLNVVDMNKLGVLFLNDGVYNGKRIISKDYINMCSTPQIKSKDTDWGDYSFQFWMVPEGEGYRADGMYGQLTIIWPKYNLTLSFQRPEDDNLAIVMDILREEVLSKI